MKRVLIFICVCVGLNLSMISPQRTTALLTLVNKNRDMDVYVRLLGMTNGRYYYLTEPGHDHPESTTFEIQRDIYFLAVYACGSKLTGSLNMNHNARLVFPTCSVGNYYAIAPNAGEPSQEKVDLFHSMPEDGVAEEKLLWRLEFYPLFSSKIKDGDLPRYLFPPYQSQVRWQLDWYSWYTAQLDGNNILYYH